MRRLAFNIATFIAPLLLATLTHADQAASFLKWDEQEIKTTAELGQEKVEVAYSFTNSTDQVVEIAETHTSCGCTVPELAKKTFQPGEMGTLDVVFDIGSRNGLQHKTISVVAVQGEQTAEYRLQLEVDIPQAVKITPLVRFWKIDDELAEKEFTITFHPDLAVELTDLHSKSGGKPSDYDYTITTVTPRHEYSVKIKPKSTAKKSRDVLLLDTNGNADTLVCKAQIYLYVR